MLDRLSKKILRYMRTASENPSKKHYNFSDDLNEIAKITASDSETVRAAVRYLEKTEYIAYMRTTDGRAVRFYLDHKGLHSKEISWLECLDFFKKSILTPIIVAFLTSILTINLWPALIQWLQTLLLQTQ